MDILSIATSVASQGSYAVLSFFVGYLLNELTINPTVSNKVFTAIADITLDNGYNNCVRYGNLVMCNLNFTANSDIAWWAKIISTPYKTISNSIGVAYGFNNTSLIPLRIDAGTNIIHLVGTGLTKDKSYDLNLCYFTKD